MQRDISVHVSSSAPFEMSERRGIAAFFWGKGAGCAEMASAGSCFLGLAATSL